MALRAQRGKRDNKNKNGASPGQGAPLYGGRANRPAQGAGAARLPVNDK
jgi:hypothetical protein